MLIVDTTRESFISVLPAQGIGAEIGVARGAFSEFLLKKAKPSHLYLVDPWGIEEAAQTRSGDEGTGDDYAHVQQKFAADISKGTVTLVRNYGSSFAEQLADRSLDWVYIDGPVTYDITYKNLKSLMPKVKEGGFILGHDYQTHRIGLQKKYLRENEVPRAVGDFLKEHGLSFAAMTLEPYSTYIICRPEQRTALESKIKESFVVYEFAGSTPPELTQTYRKSKTENDRYEIDFRFTDPSTGERLEIRREFSRIDTGFYSRKEPFIEFRGVSWTDLNRFRPYDENDRIK